MSIQIPARTPPMSTPALFSSLTRFLACLNRGLLAGKTCLLGDASHAARRWLHKAVGAPDSIHASRSGPLCSRLGGVVAPEMSGVV